MGDRLATIDMGRTLGPPFCGGELGSYLTQCRLGQDLAPYQVAFWSIQPFGHNRYGPRIGELCPFLEGELGPHLTQCCQDRGLCLHAKLFRLDLSNRLANRQNTPTSQTWKTEQRGQRSDSIWRTVLQRVAQKWTVSFSSTIKSWECLIWPQPTINCVIASLALVRGDAGKK